MGRKRCTVCRLIRFQTDRQTSVLPTRRCREIRLLDELLPGTLEAFSDCWHGGNIRVSVPGNTKLLSQLLALNPVPDRTKSRGQEWCPLPWTT